MPNQFIDRFKQSRFSNSSVLALIAANLYPIVGVIFLDWDVFPILLFFWLENVVAGFFAVIKILLASSGQTRMVYRVFLAIFFCFHYGIFTVVHGIFVIALFDTGLVESAASGNLSDLFAAIRELNVDWGALALIASHGFSLVKNYIGKKEYRNAEPGKVMLQPYARMTALHITAMAGGFLITLAGSPAAAMAPLVFLKIGIDIWGHLRERKKAAAGS